jgi:glycosyltransferase involved in cell wall biosynthesis
MLRSKLNNSAVAIIDWNISGHHPMYLREYTLAFSEQSIPVVVLSPEPPDIAPLPSSVAWKKIPTTTWMKRRQLFGMPIARWLFARRLLKVLRQAERSFGVSCSRVFFGCFHENQSKIITRAISTLRLPASGLYVQAGIFHSEKYLTRCKLTRKVERLFKHELLKKIFMLDEEKMNVVANFSGKPVQYLPDITDCSVDDSDPLPRQLGLEPKIRPIIGLLGHLRPSKGIRELISFARSTPDLDVSFLLAGSCRWEEFETEDVKYIKQAIQEDSRIVFHPERIPTETSYNALVRACDVLWAVYRDCPHSSNTIAKAAFFEKPVVVAEGYLMARQTRKYRLGEVVPRDEPSPLKKALSQMLNDPEGWRTRNNPRWLDFRREMSNESFRSLLREGVLTCWDS